MINLNVNRIEARLNRPGPNLITDVNYLVIGGGMRGSQTLGDPGGQSGEFLTGSFGFLHGTSATFKIGRGALGHGSTTTGLANAASSSYIDYPTNSLTITGQPGSGSAQDCNPAEAGDIYPCNEKGSWVHDPSTYNKWAQDGGKSYDVPGTSNDQAGVGGGQIQSAGGSVANYPWTSNRGGVLNYKPAYNGSGGGGGSGISDGFSGDGADGVVGFAIYDPNSIFDVEISAPTRGGADVTQAQTIVTWNGYRIWYFHGTYSTGTFTIKGRNQ